MTEQQRPSTRTYTIYLPPEIDQTRLLNKDADESRFHQEESTLRTMLYMGIRSTLPKVVSRCKVSIVWGILGHSTLGSGPKES